MVTELLRRTGLSVGTYTSPHLEPINERIAWNGEPIDDDALGEAIGAVAEVEALAGVTPSYFEILTAAAFRWFADVAVDVAVIEVGHARPLRRHQRRRRHGRRAHQRRPRPHRRARRLAGRRSPARRSASSSPAPRSCWARPTRTCARSSPTAPADAPGSAARTSTATSRRWRSAAGSSTCARRPASSRTSSSRCTAPTRPTTPPSRSPPSRRSSAGRSTTTSSREAFAGVRVPGRFEVVHREPTVVLDAAHNVDGAAGLRGHPGRGVHASAGRS